MRTLPALLSLLLALGSAGPACAAEIFPPAGMHRADILIPAMPKSVEAIGQRLQAAVAADPAWLEAYLREQDLKPGQHLPYHQKLGVSEGEYQHYLKSIDKMTLRKMGEAVVQVKTEAGKVVIEVTGAALPVRTFTFKEDGTEMDCELGKTTLVEEVKDLDAIPPIGKWTGKTWVLEEGRPNALRTNDFLNVRISVGTTDKGRNLIYFRMLGRHKEQALDVNQVALWGKEG